MKRAIQLLLALGMSAFFVWLSLRKTDVGAVWETILRADLKLIAIGVLISVIVHFLRTIRWGLLLEPLGRPKFSELNALSAVGFMALMVLPLRLGEFARPLLAAGHLKISRTAAMASVVVERVVDGLIMALLLVALLWSIPPEKAGDMLVYYRKGGALIALGWGCGLAVLVFAVWQHDRFVAILRSTVGRVAPGLATKIETLLSSFIEGLRVLPSVGKAIWFFVLTFAYWFISGLALKILGPAFGLDFNLKQAFTILGMQVIGAMVPAGPGMIGVSQTFTQLGISFSYHGVDTQAAAFANTVWFIQFAQQVLFGLWFVMSGRVKLGEVFSFTRPTDSGDSKDDDSAKRDVEATPVAGLTAEK
jgi:uncharacterized protein (TIRG00374 family)